MQEKLWCKYFMSATLTSVTCERNLKTSEVASEKGSMRVGHGCGFSVWGHSDGCTWACLTARVPQVQSYCCGSTGDSHVDTDTLLLIKPLIIMSGLLSCILHCLCSI